MVTCGYAASFGANLQMPRIVPGLPEVQADAGVVVDVRLLHRTPRRELDGPVDARFERRGLGLGHERLITTCQYYLGVDKKAAKDAHRKFLQF